ncbi:MAG: hypothetical protein JXN60_00310, partial [Lentisphaerae bacterium]|nr:hypothetical protein [Lentisphaerota bacterium]
SLGLSGFFGRSLTSYLVAGAFLFGWTVVMPLLGGLIATLADLTSDQQDLLGFFAWYHNPFFPLIFLSNEHWGETAAWVVVRIVYCMVVWFVLSCLGLLQAARGLKREVY